MAIDPTFGMPTERWQPTSSYNAPMVPPNVDPDTGDLVQLPCVNQAWVPWILGSLDQLRLPYAYDVPDDATRELQLKRVDLLRSMMSGSVSTPCCNVSMQLTSQCELQYSVDGGVHWTTVTDWDLNFPGCVKNNIPPAVPTVPTGVTTAQNACNMAAFLASQVIREATTYFANNISSGISEVKYAQQVMSLIAFAFPITAAALTAFGDYYEVLVAQAESAVAAAAADPVLWADVACVIYSAISGVGYVDASNFNAVATALGAISYSQPWVPPALSAFWTHLGLGNVQALQEVGTLDDADCTGCSGWCYEIDLRTTNSGINPHYLSPYCDATWVSGTGWVGCYASGPNLTESVLQWTVSGAGLSPFTCAEVDVGYFLTGSGSMVGTSRIEFYYLGTLFFSDVIHDADFYPPAKAHYVFPGGPHAMDELVIYLYDDGNKVQQVNYIEFKGTGVSPFGPNNCID